MLRNETHRWLLRLCDTEGTTGPPQRRLRQDQFAKLLNLADEHGVLAAVLANLNTIFALDGVSRVAKRVVNMHAVDALLSEARQANFVFAATSLSLRQRTDEVLDALTYADVETSIIKGEDFADRLYRPAGLRPFRDIDLMLARQSMDVANAVMRGLGWREIPTGKHSDGYGEQAWDSVDPIPVRVELHWNLVNSPSQRTTSSLDFSELLWTESKRGERAIRRADAASMLLIAGVHAVISHRFDRLQHLCDIRQIYRGIAGPIDAQHLLALAKQTGTRTALRGAFEVSARMPDDPPCRELLQRLQLPGSRRAWRMLVSDATLLEPSAQSHKLRRVLVREWMKRAA